MQKSILIVGAGTGLSLSVALKFGSQGYTVGLISRNEHNLKKISQVLMAKNIQSFYKSADVKNASELQNTMVKNSGELQNAIEKNTSELQNAINVLVPQLGGIDTLFYNAANLKATNILEETLHSLTEDFIINVIGAQQAFKILYPDLKKSKGSMLIAGGGLAFKPNPDYGSLAIGKAGIRNLALQLNEIGKENGIYVGILNITGRILADSETNSPQILAEKFWKLNTDRTLAEETY